MRKTIKTLKQMRKTELLRTIAGYRRSDLKVMITMFNIYRRNRVAVVDVENGELCPYEVRDFVDRKMVEF